MTRSLPSDGARAVACAVALGAASTVGDWIWSRYLTDGAVLPGLIHGLIVFVLLALALGLAASAPDVTKRLLATLPLAGLLIAAAFYPLAMALGYVPALLLTWAAMWLSLAFLQRWARGRTESRRAAWVRGLLATIGSGLAFWAISGIWTAPAPDPSYALRLLQWSFAFLPGFLALLLGHPRPRAS